MLAEAWQEIHPSDFLLTLKKMFEPLYFNVFTPMIVCVWPITSLFLKMTPRRLAFALLMFVAVLIIQATSAMFGVVAFRATIHAIVTGNVDGETLGEPGILFSGYPFFFLLTILAMSYVAGMSLLKAQEKVPAAEPSAA